MDARAIADALLSAYVNISPLAPISDSEQAFRSDDAYTVLDEIAARRVGQGWSLAGRKIGFTNRTIWEIYGVDRPMWAHLWDETVVRTDDNRADVALDRFIAPRIEPEVVFGLRDELARCDDPADLIHAVDWVAPGFEIVHCHYPDWKFTIADCTADFGLHGALVVGAPLALDRHNTEEIVRMLPTFELALSRDGAVAERGVGANVLDGPLHALAHLTRVLDEQTGQPPLGAGDIVTTGTITNALPIKPGETWSSDYGSLGIDGLTVTFR